MLHRLPDYPHFCLKEGIARLQSVDAKSEFLPLLPLLCFHNRMKNPYLRAKFAEVLEAVMPHMEPIASGAVQPVMFQRERLFCTYTHAAQLAEALITVFVDIEFTGKDLFSKFAYQFFFCWYFLLRICTSSFQICW